MAFDGISSYFFTKEVAATLVDMRVDKIQMPGRYDVALGFRAPGQSLRLLLSANPAEPKFYISSEKVTAPQDAPMFCMLLRKHLQGARLLEMKTCDFERVIHMRFQKLNELGDSSEKLLYFELMGRHSNLILLNRDGLIVDAISHVDARVNRFREILPARPYVPPPPQDKRSPAQLLLQFNRDPSLFWSGLSPKLPLPKALLEQMAGFSPALIQSLFIQAQLDEKNTLLSIRAAERLRLQLALSAMLEAIVSADLSPSVYYTQTSDPSPSDFHVLALPSAKSQKFSTINEAVSFYYEQRNQHKQFQQQKDALLKQVGLLLDQREKKALVHQQDYDDSLHYLRYKEEGELILAYMHQIPDGAANFSCLDFYHDNLACIVNLNPNRSASWNAQTAFRRYNRLKRKHESSISFLKIDREEIQYLLSVQDSVEHAESATELAAIKEELTVQNVLAKPVNKQKGNLTFQQRKSQRRKGEEKASAAVTPGPRKFISSSGLSILVGRNNMQNDKLTLRSAHKQDYWFHVRQAAGSHVVLHCAHSAVAPSDQDIAEAASLAAWYSNASKASAHAPGNHGGQVAVDYCLIAEVKKPSGAKPGHVIYEHYKTVYVTAAAPADLLPASHILP